MPHTDSPHAQTPLQYHTPCYTKWYQTHTKPHPPSCQTTTTWPPHHSHITTTPPLPHEHHTKTTWQPHTTADTQLPRPPHHCNHTTTTQPQHCYGHVETWHSLHRTATLTVLVFKQLVNKTPCKFCLPRPDFQYGHVFASRNFSALTTNQGNIHSHHDDTEETVGPTLTEVLGVGSAGVLCFPKNPDPSWFS